MADFQYRVVTPGGKEKKGSLEAKSTEQAKALLKAEGNIVLSLDEAGFFTKDLMFSFGGKVKPRDFSIFCRQFVSIINAGVSVISALDMLADQTENKLLRKGIEGVHADVSKGESLAKAMKKREAVFPGMLCNMVEAGEASGNLEVAFERMAIQFEKDNKLKESVKKAMIYPVIVIFVMIGVLVAMMMFVIPNFMSMFDDMETELPMVTQMVVAMSDFMREKWWLMLLIVAAVVTAYKLYAKTSNGKFVIGAIKLKIPILGKLQTKSSCARLGRTLCTLLAAGVPMIEALDITARSMENVHFKKAMTDAKEQVSRGVPLSKPLKKCGLFPPMVIHMISIGEETGNIETMLENIAIYYEDDVQATTEQLTAMMEPLIIVVMALMVGFLVMAIMSPMLKLYETLDAL